MGLERAQWNLRVAWCAQGLAKWTLGWPSGRWGWLGGPWGGLSGRWGHWTATGLILTGLRARETIETKTPFKFQVAR